MWRFGKQQVGKPVTGCEVFGIAFPDGVAVEQHQAAATGLLWHEDKLYVGATGTLVEIDPAGPYLQSPVHGPFNGGQ